MTKTLDPASGDSKPALRILHLEDNPVDAELVQYELKEAGFAFTAMRVETGDGFRKALKEFSPDIILSDYDLPDYDGASALIAAKEQCPDIPFILVTGAVTEERAIEILTSGAKDYVLKKRLTRLVPAVRRALMETEEHRARRQAEKELRLAHRSLEKKVAERTAELQKEIEARRRTEARLHRNNERLEILSYTAGRLLETEKPQAIVKELCRRVMLYLDCQVFFNYLPSGDPGRLRLNAYAGIPAEEARKIEHLDYGTAVCGCVARDGSPIIAEDIRNNPEERTDLVASFGVQAFACHPLVFQGKVIGTLAFGTRTRTGFSRDDLDMMKSVTDQVAIAMNRIRTEEALSENRIRLETIFETLPNVLVEYDLNGRPVRANKPALKAAGLTSMDFTRDQVLVKLHFMNLDGTTANYEDLPVSRALRGEKVNGDVFKINSADGNERIISNYAVPLYKDGRINGVVALCHDITELKQTEEALRANQENFEHLIEFAPTGIYELDYGTPRFKRVNDAMCRILGYTREELLTMNPSLLLDPDSRMRFQERILKVLSGQAIEPNVSFRVLTRSGREVWAALDIKIMYEHGKPAGALVVAHDISELKRTEEDRERLIAKLETANKELESFVYSVSHDLRAPLRAIDGFSAMLSKTLSQKLDEEERHKFNHIRDNTRKMNHLIDDLLALSRIGRAELTRNRFDMNRLANAVWQEQAAANPHRKMEIRKGDLPAATGDQSLLWQVFSNLLANAVKYTRKRKGAVIEIGGKSTEAENIYFVKDNGAGFDMRYHDQLFGVFQRLHSETEYEGTGIGLAIVKRIVQMHGGRVWAEGRVGKGATFYFALPNT